jgi:histidinol-phosphate aminotransferase
LMVDEAYFHFHGETVLSDLATTPNLVIARTFSKAYGLASLRIGMLAGNVAVMQYVRKASSPYNVNGIALECLTAAIEDDAYICWYAEQILIGRERVMGGLDELGVHYFPSAANFVLMKIGPLHKELVTAMRRRGILLRDRSSDPGCDGYVRITIGIGDQVTRGLEALKESLNEIGWKPIYGFSTAENKEAREL